MRVLLPLGLMAAAMFAFGCATEVGNYTPIGQRYPAKPNKHPIDVYTNGLPTREFERVAFLDAHCESQGFMTPNLQQDALPMLIKQARLAGCDGIIEIEERKASDNWTFETKVKRFSGVGIVYK